MEIVTTIITLSLITATWVSKEVLQTGVKMLVGKAYNALGLKYRIKRLRALRAHNTTLGNEETHFALQQYLLYRKTGNDFNLYLAEHHVALAEKEYKKLHGL